MEQEILQYMFKCTIDNQECKFIVYGTTCQRATEQFRGLCYDTFGTVPSTYSYALLKRF